MNKVPNQDLLYKWFVTQLQFLKPFLVVAGIFYFAFLIPQIQDNGVQLQDFVPTNAVITSIVMYVANAIYAYLLKLKESNKRVDGIYNDYYQSSSYSPEPPLSPPNH